MKKFSFVSDNKSLLRQAIAAWVVLFISVIIFVILALLLSLVIDESSMVVILTLVLVVPITIGLHVFLYKQGYSLRKASSRTKQHEKEQLNQRAIILTTKQQRTVDNITTSTHPRMLTSPWYLELDPQHRLIRGKIYRVLKRAMDLSLCLMIAPLALPLMLLIMVLVYIDSPGPIFFRQLRTGKGGRRFRMYKFRTMVPNAEELKLAYAHLNELTWPDFKITNDPRVTRIGHILREADLDELPQILNVIKGDMSLVGPRPMSFSPETYRLWHTSRLEVVPGIIGLWRVHGRSNLDFDDRLKLDIAYIERQSIWMDIQIIIRTVCASFFDEEWADVIMTASFRRMFTARFREGDLS